MKAKNTKNNLPCEFVPSLILKSDNKLTGIIAINYFDRVDVNRV